MIKFYWSLIFTLCSLVAFSTDKVVIDNTLTSNLVGQSISYLEDPGGKMEFSDVVRSGNFSRIAKDIANFQESKSTFWLRFTISNKNNTNKNFIEVVQPLLDVVDFIILTLKINIK